MKPLPRKPTKRLDGKVAIVTGGASGIGRALAGELASRGARLVLADRQHDLAIEVARVIEQKGGAAEALELDVRDRAAFAALADDVKARHGRIDFLFNNAGISVGGELVDYGPNDYDDVLDVNLRGVTHGIAAVYPKMVAQGFGHIVNTASVAGLVASPTLGSYTASKHAVVGLSKALCVEARRHGVKVTALCPGPIDTPIWNGGKFGRIIDPNISPAQLEDLWKTSRPMDPLTFAKAAVDEILTGRPIVVLPKVWRLAWLLERISPSLALSVAGAVHDRLRRSRGSIPASRKTG